MAAVTVVMPTYLRQEYLKEAIDSLVAQEFSDFTALVCDNANSEETRELVASYGDERLVYVPRPQNLGLVRNCLEGFRAARSEFVTKLDDDDAFEPGYLARTVEALRAHPDDVEVPEDPAVRRRQQVGLPVLTALPRTPAAVALEDLARRIRAVALRRAAQDGEAQAAAAQGPPV